MQRTVDVEVGVAAFVSKIARRAVLTRVKAHEGGQIRIDRMSPAFGYLAVHGGLSIKTRRRVHPNKIEISGTFRACPDGQRIFEVCRVHLVTQRGLLARGWETIELPSLVGAGFDHVGVQGHLQPLRHRCRRHDVITPLQGGHGLMGEPSLLALESRVLVVQVGAGKCERSTPGQEATIVQQDTNLLAHEGVQRLAAAASHRTTPDIGAAAPDQVGQCYAQASPNRLDLVIDVAEGGSPVDARRLGLFPDRLAPVIGLKDAMMLDDERSVRELRRQAHDQGAEHVAAARGVLVRHKVAPCPIDIEVV